MPATSDLLDTPTMRQLDTGALVTLKQRIERELMRRGDVEQTELTQRESPFELDGTAATVVATPETLTFGANSVTSSATPLAQRQLLREPDPGCTRCWGRGIVVVPDTHIAVTLTRLCPCLWGGE